MILRFAVKELLHSGTRLKSVLAILLIGFVGPLFASSLRSSVDAYLSERSRQILSADLLVSALRQLKDEEIRRIEEALTPKRASRETEFVTMARGQDVATLVEVKGVDESFPIFGRFKLRDRPAVASAAALSQEKIAWVFPEVLAQLGLKTGDRVGIGRTDFEIREVVEDGPGVARTAGVAPRVYIGRKFIEDTGLVMYGAQVSHRLYLELPPGLDQETASARVKALIADPDIFLRTPDDSVRGFERFFKFFNMYLVSVTMIVFVLSWMSAFYILQIFLQDRLRNAAVLLVNGASRAKTGALYVLQVFMLMLLAFVLSTLVVLAVTWATPTIAGPSLPEGFVLRVTPRDWLSLLAVALASAVAFTAPFLGRLWLLKIQSLLGESALGVEQGSRGTTLVTYAPMLLVFLGLSAWLMGSAVAALRLAGGMVLAAGVGLVVGRALFALFFRSVRLRPGLTRLVATSLARSRFGVNLCFLALVLVGLALNLVPHLLASVVSAVMPLKGKEVPAFFLFNIPESQVDALKGFAERQRIELRYLSPMILARLQKINGKEAEGQFLRFPVRLSYRPERIPSESITAGRELPGKWDGKTLPEISVEEDFAERNEMRIGDELEFDVQGVPISGRVTSFRHVNWTTFNPNFFMMFQPGVLDDAPKTYVSNVNIEGGEAERVKFQYDLIREFPDVTVIDIGRTAVRVLEVAQSVIGPVRAAAWLAVGMSFLILIGVINHNLRLRHAEVDIEKLLGADSGLIRRMIVGEYFATAVFAWIVGAGSALALAWAVLTQVLDLPLVVAGDAIAGSIVVLVGTTAAIAFVSCTRVLNLRGASRKL